MAGQRKSAACVSTQEAYIDVATALFVELPGFARHRGTYLDDEGFRRLQTTLMARPDAGDVIEGTGGLRKLRFRDSKRGKGKRGGLRIVYFWWNEGKQFWLFGLFGKDEATDLTAGERAALRALIKAELRARGRP